MLAGFPAHTHSARQCLERLVYPCHSLLFSKIPSAQRGIQCQGGLEEEDSISDAQSVPVPQYCRPSEGASVDLDHLIRVFQCLHQNESCVRTPDLADGASSIGSDGDRSVFVWMKDDAVGLGSGKDEHVSEARSCRDRRKPHLPCQERC